MYVFQKKSQKKQVPGKLSHEKGAHSNTLKIDKHHIQISYEQIDERLDDNKHTTHTWNPMANHL